MYPSLPTLQDLHVAGLHFPAPDGSLMMTLCYADNCMAFADAALQS